MINIQNDWASSDLLSLLQVLKSGGTPNTSRESYYGGDIPFVAIQDMTSTRKYLTNTAKMITEEGLKNSNAWLVPAGSILYSIYATLGVPRINTNPVSTNQAILALITRPEKIDRDYLYYWLEFIRDAIFNLSSQTTQSNLSAGIVKTFTVNYPIAVSEQIQIANILGKIDQAIAQTEANIAKQQRIKTGLMQDLLTKGIDENGNIRSEATHKFKDSLLGRIPVEWEVKRVDELLSNVNPAMRSGPFGSALKKDELADYGVPLLGIDNVHVERFCKDYIRFVPPKKASQLSRYQVRAHDVMITIMGTVGRACVVPEDVGAALSSKHVWTLTFNRNIYSPTLACMQFNYSPWVLAHFRQDEQGGVMASIRSETLKSTLLPVPKMAEIEIIESILNAISAYIEKSYLGCEKMRRYKTGLMHDLLTGKVRVTSTNNTTLTPESL